MRITTAILSLLLIISCSPQKPAEQNPPIKNKVLVMGMIHSGHLTSDRYGIPQLTAILKAINPDVVLTEIPPDRFSAAVTEFQTKDTITEPRVRRFPEYVNVLFPLTKEMDFDIIPTAGWTKPMADARSKRLDEISKDPEWTERWVRYQKAIAAADSAVAAGGGEDDPYWVHTDGYDNASEIVLSVYNELFNDELGSGGWGNINVSHYSYIADALDSLEGQGKLILITYGAGHKGWFLRQLRKRGDIELLDMKPFLDLALLND